jgi:copper chaperone CopZ
MSQEITFNVKGMTCASCVARVERRLKKAPGVLDATVNLATERANVTFEANAANEATLFEAVEKAGYEPNRLEVRQ